LSSFIISSSDSFELLLASSVPDLKFNDATS